MGDINHPPTRNNDRKVATVGHHSHNEGRAADFRLIGADGEAHRCTIYDPSCYNFYKSFRMVKALIDADPYNIQRVLTNDPALRTLISNYLVDQYQYDSKVAATIPRFYKRHDDHVHFHWKE